MRAIQRMVLCSVCVGLLGVSPSFADSGHPISNSNDNSALAPAGKFIQDVSERAIAALNDQNLTPKQRTDEYHRILRASFDVPTIGRFVLGSAWRGANDEQRQEYLKLFEDLIVKIYADRLTSYRGENLQVTGIRQENERDFVVTSELLHPRTGAPPTHMDWRVRQKGDSFAIIDVIVEGVSQSISQREEYAAVLNRDGGKIDGLLAQMRQQVQDINQTAG